MSFHIPGSRRTFLRTAVSAGAVAMTELAYGQGDGGFDDAGGDDDNYVFLSDTHIAADKTKVVFDANMFANLSRAIDEVLELPRKPTAVFVNGDCAYLKGLPEDYATFAKAIKRLSDADIAVHMTMGNHDDRGPFAAALRQHVTPSPVEGKFVSIIRGKRVNWFLLDSLQIVDNVTGEIGPQQRRWLSEALEQHADLPAIVLGHHNPQYLPEGSDLPEGSAAKVTGLADTAELVDVFHSHRHIKAYVYGHTHQWKLGSTAGKVHLINLPPTAYLFDPSRPNGWVHARATDQSLDLTLHAFDVGHAAHLSEHRLAYR